MTKRVINIPTFQPNQTLRSIREGSLNPVIERVLKVQTNVEDVVVPKLDTAYDNVSFDEAGSKLSFTNIGGKITDIDLSSIVPVFAGIEVKGYNEEGSISKPGTGSVKQASVIKYKDADITKDPADGFARVVYQWDKIVPTYQSEMTVEIPSAVPNMARGPYDHLEIIGEGAKEYFAYSHSAQVEKGKITINMPLIPKQMNAKVQDTGTEPKYEGPINDIEILGNIGGSIIRDGVLYVDMPDGGGPVRTTRYFEGFYNSTGDLEAAVTDPYIDRSCAYVLIEGTYVLHMYKGKTDGWKPVKTRATIIYKGDGTTPDQGVTSIKRDENISITSDGELDLSELGKHGGELPAKDFKGIFATVEEIKALKDDLIEDMSYAMLRSANAKNAFSTYYYRKENPDEEPSWNLTPNLGHLVLIEDSMEVGKYKPIYGVKAPSSAFSNKRGVLDLTKGSIKGTIKAIVSGKDESVPAQTAEVRTIRYPLGAADAYITGDSSTLVVTPAQRIIEKFDSDWVNNHSSDDYIGKIYYNGSTGRWLGMTDKMPPDKFSKWTTIAHRGMSDQVFSLVNRYPEQLIPFKEVSPEGDPWSVGGRAYLPLGDKNLPDEIKETSGGFLQTDVKMNTAAEGEKSNEIRVQICRPDLGQTGVYQRSYNSEESKWNPWVKTSFTSEEFAAHQVDPEAHRNILKYYRAYALLGSVKEIFTQITGQSFGGFKNQNSQLLADSHGYSPLDEYDYLDAPYDGTYNINGVLSFAGYTEDRNGKIKANAGRWNLLLRKKSKDTGAYSQAGFFTYEHTDESKPYPPLFFDLKDVELESHQEVVINMTFTNASSLTTDNPSLYLVASRSNIAIEDNRTRAGGAIVAALRKIFGNMDSVGTAAIKAHHTTEEDPSSSIRIVGEVVQKIPTKMTPHD